MANKSPVGDMPRMVPDREDIRRRQSNTLPPAERQQPAKSGGSWVLILLVIISGIAIGYLALQQYSLHQLLGSYEERLELADERIVNLERALTETDESVAMNGTAINAQFKAIKTETDMHMSEIRKLWDVANKRNRNWIEENQAALEKQDQNLNSALANLAKVVKAQEVDAAAIADLNNQATASQKAIKALQSSFAGIDDDLNALEQTMASLASNNFEEQILTLTLNQENMLAEQNKVAASAETNANQLATVVKQLAAVDASRLETSRRLSALSGQIETLGAQLTELTGTSP